MTTDDIVAALNNGAYRANVDLYWPKILRCMQDLKVWSPASEIAAIATIGVETARRFEPLHEFGGAAYLNELYDSRTDLGNTPDKDGDGALYCGRGFAQLTGKANYIHYGNMLGIDLVGHPERAMDPDVAASVFAAFFREKKINVAADAKDWMKVRRLWNGGLNGYADFLKYVDRLTSLQGSSH